MYLFVKNKHLVLHLNQFRLIQRLQEQSPYFQSPTSRIKKFGILQKNLKIYFSLGLRHYIIFFSNSVPLTHNNGVKPQHRIRIITT